MRRRAKVDTNHAEIVEALRKKGLLVLSMAAIGDGCPDLLVFRGWRPVDLETNAFEPLFVLVELKTPRGKLTADQEKFRAAGWPVTIVRSVEEALAL